MTWRMHGDPMMWGAGFPLTHAHADRCVDEHRLGARLVGLGLEAVPGSRAEPVAGPGARVVDEFLLRPTTHPLLIPAREVLWRRVAHLAYAALPPCAHELYGRPALAPAVVTRRLRATGGLLRGVPARPRRQLPPKHVLRAMARPGPDARPAPYKRGR
ncbi:oxygenase MpaB family protein [Streptomyces monashensis]|uniref:oxygenase MpaB family protein n=1 Tax=Streptomyces monashensis TaxID=1678012 RepID=UPI00318336A5